MNLLHVFSDCEQGWDGAEWLAEIICVETGGNHPDSTVSKGLADFHQIGAEELGLVYSDNLSVCGNVKHFSRILNGD